MRTCRRVLKTCFVVAALMSTAVTAQAVDLPARPHKGPAPVVAYDWTGMYVGGHLGWGSADDLDGFLGGGQVGLNYQFGQWVAGVEGQFSWSDISKGGHSIDWVSTLAARFGLAFNRWLIYGKVGAAWADFKAPGFSETDSGMMIGFGTEYAFGNNWSGKIEYNVIDFDGKDNLHLVKAGINYRFAPLPWSRY